MCIIHNSILLPALLAASTGLGITQCCHPSTRNAETIPSLRNL